LPRRCRSDIWSWFWLPGQRSLVVCWVVTRLPFFVADWASTLAIPGVGILAMGVGILAMVLFIYVNSLQSFVDYIDSPPNGVISARSYEVEIGVLILEGKGGFSKRPA